MYQPEKLKERRVAQGLTQQELANALGVSKQAYSAWERGVKVPASDKVEQLEKLLSVPKGYFTEIEIVRLYHTLTPPNQEKAVRYVRALATAEQTPKVVPMKKKLVAYHVYEKMSAGIGRRFTTTETTIRFTTMKSWRMILRHGYRETRWNHATTMDRWRSFVRRDSIMMGRSMRWYGTGRRLLSACTVKGTGCV